MGGVGEWRTCAVRYDEPRLAGPGVDESDLGPVELLLFITAGPITKLSALGEGNSGGHVL
jgi:hypothetical protein